MFDDNNNSRNTIIEMIASDDDAPEFISLLSPEEEEEMDNESLPQELSILPLRNTVLFPGVVFPITVGRDKSIKLINDAYKGDKIIGVVAQRSENIEDPLLEDLHAVGTVAQIIKMLRMPDGNITAILRGRKRFKPTEIIQQEPYLRAKVEVIHESKIVHDPELDATISSLKEMSTE
ncbi:MAG: LON peptidase substrate-binding domain-containing protein, partial [Bacteroidetes bacterium]|nr:LON peptidase substrate-binding domain-containing protein [Bacteroidota bacterium]